MDAGKGKQADDCEDCIAGYFAVSGMACSACAAGKYVEAGKGTKLGDCKDCPAGQYAAPSALERPA